MFKQTSTRPGFTIVELLIVIVVIGILAAVTVVAYNGVQAKARLQKMNADLTQLSTAIQMARQEAGQTMLQLTGQSWTAASCVNEPVGTDLAALPRTDNCWVDYLAALNAISVDSGTNVRSLVDPWGRPYYLDANEGENGNCGYDTLAAFSQPFNGNSTFAGTWLNVPHIGLTGCPL